MDKLTEDFLASLIAMGIIIGFVFLLVNVYVFSANPMLIPWEITLAIILILSEVIFWKFNSFNLVELKKNKSIFWFTAKQKIISLTASTLGVILIIRFYEMGKASIPIIQENQAIIMQWLGYFGIAFLVLVVFILLIYFNSMKYKRRGK